MWFLADDDDHHPYTKELKDYHDSLGADEKKKFRKRMMSMVVNHLVIVARQILVEAVLRRTTMQRLVFCVPNAWDTPNFQVVLKPIMDRVAVNIGVPTLDRYCVFESEVLAQFFLHQHAYLLADYRYALVCDFGGHFMVSMHNRPRG